MAQIGRVVVDEGASEEAIAWLYLKFSINGELKKAFPEDSINLPKLLDILSRCRVFVAKDNRDGACREPFGLGWLLEEGHRAMCGIAFVDNTSIGGISLPMKLYGASAMIDMAFAGNKALVVLYAKTLSSNKPALLFERMLGFQLFGPIPYFQCVDGRPEDGWIAVMTRERWRTLRRNPRTRRK